MIEKYIELFACRVCRSSRESLGHETPCQNGEGQYCPHIEAAKAMTEHDIARDKVLVKRGEIH